MSINLGNALSTFHQGGIHPDDAKLSAKSPIKPLPTPKMVTIPVAQHIGKPAKILVQRGDMVKAGQIIATHEGFVSANIHSSVCGKVGIIDEMMDSTGFKHTAITIRVKGDDWADEIDLSDDLKTEITASPKEIVEKIMASGVVGMGGAAFPSHVKLSVPEGKAVDHLLINGVECEPFLTADHRLMLEKPEEILVGTQVLMKALGVKKAIIGIEDNKHDAIELLSSIAAGYEGISVKGLRVKYPQGGEKQLIQALLDREVPSGGLPIDVGAIVHNVGTTYAVYQAVQKNKPLIERVVTVTGRSLTTPSNFLVRIGTPVVNLIAEAGGLPETAGKVVSGGPMMGKALADLNVPIAKATSGILIIDKEESKRQQEYNCLHCGKCVEVCPIGLEPYYLMLLAKNNKASQTSQEHILDCIECGSCSWVCPSNRPILDYIRLGKKEVKKTQTA
ncbi:MAG: electron transport complex subunit RsxC [Bacteroidota bacterium]